MIRTIRLTCALLILPAACATSQQPAATLIHDIQGRSHTSPLLGRHVDSFPGVVTAVLSTGRAPGFWMQDAKPDRDDATSEGIFVSTKDAPAEVTVGDAVAVSGNVAEQGFPDALTTTQITKPSVTIISHGNALPAPVLLGSGGRAIPSRIVENDAFKIFDPREDAIDFWESLEGMRVEVRDPLVVGATSGYGDLVVVSDGGRGAENRGRRGGLVLRADDVNPERIIVESRLVKDPPIANTGDHLAGAIAGIVDYNFGNYRMLNTAPLPAVVAGAQPPEVTTLRGDAGHLTIATYNVLNLSARNDASKFAAVGKSIAVNLAAPDVIALEEIQDDSGPANDGVVTAAATLTRLVDAIAAAGGPRYDSREIDPRNNEDGGQPGANIRVAILFNPARVGFVDRDPGGATVATSIEAAGGLPRLTHSPGRVDPANPCFSAGSGGSEPTRKSLAAELKFGTRTFFVIANHLKSKRGDTPTFGAIQPPVPRTEEQRTCQAEVIGRFAASILSLDPTASVVVLGDMNEHEFRPPMKRLAEVSGLTNLIDQVPIEDRYTFSFEGNLQILDNLFVSPSLLRDGAPEIDIVHANADLAGKLAASDHDPVLVRLKM